MLFLLGTLFGIGVSMIAAGLIIVAIDRGWFGPWWRGF